MSGSGAGGDVHEVASAARRAKAAGRILAKASSQAKDEALRRAAELIDERQADILAANEVDLARAASSGATPTVVDRLTLTPARISAMCSGIEAVIALPDPVGEVLEGWVRPNGLCVRRVRVPLGVVCVIYENRPNVTSDAGVLCLKSGNAALLRGSSGAIESNKQIAACLRDGAEKAGLSPDVVVLVEDVRHESVREIVRLRGLVDCVIPRGGPELVRTIVENATVPYVIDGDGNCHVYVDAAADLDSAVRIVQNAKTQRPSVCNAMESLLVHESVAPAVLPRLAEALEGVEIRGDAATRAILPSAADATEEDFATEFLALTLSVAVVPSLDAAIEHIARYGSGHSEAIVTSDKGAADRFVREVDAAA
ncbi:MAG TPA: glutamate-5-semialdehyde dehydrogenase, partial [Acidimicrobiales bacterium]|nr:glutamate-5-semialdehyde dehydrogenase [Acidimicrobiales bacterium]